MFPEPNEQTIGKTGDQVKYTGQYAAIGCCRMMTRLERGDTFPTCVKDGITTWGWIPPGSAMGLTDVDLVGGFSAYYRQPLTRYQPVSSGTVFGLYGGSGLFPSSTPISEVARTPPSIGIDPKRYEQLQKAESEVIGLNMRLAEINKNLRESQARHQATTEKLKEKEEVEEELKAKLEHLAKEKELQHITDRIEPSARKLLHRLSTDLLKCFEEGSCHAFVMSVDIRLSTSLMLKARKPELFAKFITDLCDGLRQAVWNNHGVFDKFTGDGILAFFPDKYTGEDAGYFVLSAAAECHAIFAQEYKRHRHCFTSILADVGLGVGIDYGETHLVSSWGGLTVVGEPVVYACRLGGAVAGQTLLNQRALEITFLKYKACCWFRETTLLTKSDGNLTVYQAGLYDLYNPKLPPWWPSLSEDEKPNPAASS